RKDLKSLGLSVGKLAAHVAHAAIEGFLVVQKIRPEISELWIKQGQKKVVLLVENLRELLNRYEKSKIIGVPSAVITDAGLTEIPPGTVTVLVLGPWFENQIDKVSGDLPLLKDW
ncbi:MAG: aminoacyl-tRNA hydrolase, partial [Crenarchaeota archaeon]|nr:aminoacyl-tRNA hydrolase [Thermoproteota archaeon]